MKVDGEPYRSIWLDAADPGVVRTIDQRLLPHEFVIAGLRNYRDGVMAIRDMMVRGAPLIGATAAWSVYLAVLESRRRGLPEEYLHEAARLLRAARPTAVNLQWAIDRMLAAIGEQCSDDGAVERARNEAQAICDQDVEICHALGQQGLGLIEQIGQAKSNGPVNVLTHCNAGWLATLDWGTATAPIYLAHQKGIDIHVWVDETRPRNQGSQLTAWELAHEGVPHTVIVDNAGGHLMQHGMVDLCITGTDRTTRSGDVGNKIGTYLKALAASDTGVPFYVAVPSPSIDWQIDDGVEAIPIEERPAEEVTHVTGVENGEVREVCIGNPATPVSNFAFDVTPARLVTALITERGVCEANRESLAALFPEHTDPGQ